MPERTESDSRKLLRRLRDTLAIPGKGQDRLDRITHLIAEGVEDISPLLSSLGRSHLIDPTEGRADETRRAVAPRKYHPRDQAKALFPSRDFH